MSGSVSVLDNTAAGTAVLSSSTYIGLSSTAWRAYSFTTAASSTWEIDGLRLALRASSAGSYTILFRLYATSGGTPTGSVLATTSLSMSLVTAVRYQYLDATALGAVANYSMGAGSSYALVVSALSPTLRWYYLNAGTVTPPTAASSFTYDGFRISGNSGGSWNTFTSTPAIELLATATCFLRGTLILTCRGEVPVETLRAGDLVATKFGGLRPVRWIGTQCFDGRLAGAGHQPIRFARGSLGQGMPSCDLFVSPGHAVLVGEVLVHAGALVNGSTITQERLRGEIEYFHIDLGPHDCVLANAAWAESYFEDRNRDSFHNAAAFHALHPGHVPERQATCLPIVTAEHPGIDGVRRLLAPREVRRAA